MPDSQPETPHTSFPTFLHLPPSPTHLAHEATIYALYPRLQTASTRICNHDRKSPQIEASTYQYHKKHKILSRFYTLQKQTRKHLTGLLSSASLLYVNLPRRSVRALRIQTNQTKLSCPQLISSERDQIYY